MLLTFHILLLGVINTYNYITNTGDSSALSWQTWQNVRVLCTVTATKCCIMFTKRDRKYYLPLQCSDVSKHTATASELWLIILRLFSQLTIRNCYTTSCHAGQHRLARRPEQLGFARANAATNGAKHSRQPQPGHGLVGIQQIAPLEHTSDKQAYYSFIDPGRMKGELASLADL